MYMFTITRFFVAIFLNGLYVATFTYSMELLNSKFRTFTGVNIQAQFAVGYIILGFLRAVDQTDLFNSKTYAITLFILHVRYYKEVVKSFIEFD